MKCVVVLLVAAHAIICSAYGPAYGYGVPVASQPIVYTSPTYHPSYVSPYAYTSPALSHSSFSHTQTHPAAYVKPVSSNKCWLKLGQIKLQLLHQISMRK